MYEQSQLDVSIVLPCYMEEASIAIGVSKIFEEMKKTQRRFEIIFVDDASTDNTRKEIIKAAEKYPDISYIFQNTNTGRGQAFVNGARTARGRIIGYLDIDLEISVSSLPKVIHEIDSGKDVAIVRRNFSNEWSPSFLARHLASIIYRWLVSFVLDIPQLDTETGFKFFRREPLFQLLEKAESQGWFFDTEIMCLAYHGKLKISQVDGEYKKNSKKISTVHLFSDGTKQLIQLIRYKKKLKYFLN